MKITAKRLILGLLLGRQGQPLSAREMVSACALFGVTENNVRVTLARLSADGSIEQKERGTYQFGVATRDTAQELNAWHRADQRLREWSGGYICVHTAGLGRSDRRALAQRERAFEMLGLRELTRGLFVRPDNLAGGATALRERLYRLDVEREAMVFSGQDFDPPSTNRITNLWDRNGLNRRYREQQQALAAWLDRYSALSPDVAARESYLMGAQAIRELIFDPWLPEAWIDAQARRQFVATVKRFDATGQAIWADWQREDQAMPRPLIDSLLF